MVQIYHSFVLPVPSSLAPTCKKQISTNSPEVRFLHKPDYSELQGKLEETNPRGTRPHFTGTIHMTRTLHKTPLDERGKHHLTAEMPLPLETRCRVATSAQRELERYLSYRKRDDWKSGGGYPQRCGCYLCTVETELLLRQSWWSRTSPQPPLPFGGFRLRCMPRLT